MNKTSKGFHIKKIVKKLRPGAGLRKTDKKQLNNFFQPDSQQTVPALTPVQENLINVVNTSHLSQKIYPQLRKYTSVSPNRFSPSPSKPSSLKELIQRKQLSTDKLPAFYALKTEYNSMFL